MKRAMKQSTLTLILNGISILTLIYMVYSLIAYSQVSGQLNTANEERFSLTYNANRFMNGSAYLTNEVPATSSITTTTGARSTTCRTRTRASPPCRRSASPTRSRA